MKPKRIFLILTVSVVSATAGSQVPGTIPPPPPPPPPVTSGISGIADSLVSEGNIRQAVTEYGRLLHLYPQNKEIAYQYACALSLGQQKDSAFKYLYISGKEEPQVSSLTDPYLIYLHDDPRWMDYENYTMNKVSAIRDKDYARRLWSLLCLDQFSFYETSLAAKKLGPDSPVITALRKLQEIKNANNLKELESLISVKGWPERSQVGPEASSAAFYILQHSNADAQEKYIGMFEKCCRKNEGDWHQYALMFDRMRMNKNQPQRYGTHTYMDPKAGSTRQLYPLEDDARVDEWRREIGLEPLKEYMKNSNIEYK